MFLVQRLFVNHIIKMNSSIRQMLKLCLLTSCFLVLEASKPCPGAYRTCTCHNYKYSISIFCKPVPTMLPITDMLEKYFSKTTISFLELSYCSVRNFSDTDFPSCNISSIKSYCPLEVISDQTFTNLKTLSKLSFSNTVFTKIPEPLPNLVNLESLSFDNHKIQSLDKELWNLVALKSFYMKNGELSFVSKDAFRFSKNLTFLSLTKNKLTSLTNSTFDPLENLKYLDLSENYLHLMDGLLSKLNPQTIDLYGNNITDITNLLPNGMWKLKTLHLGRNSIRNIHPSSFSNKIPNIVLLDLSNNKLKMPDVNLFQGMKDLNSLYMNFNGMEQLPKGIFRNLDQLKLINLKYNFLPVVPEVFCDLPSLELLDMSFNKLSSLDGIFRNLSRISTLHLARNQLIDISSKDFDPLSTLKVLDLSNNSIRVLNSDVFVSVPHLVSLNISYNKFSKFNSSLRDLSSLNDLRASFCRIQTISVNDFRNLTFLKSIDLTGNNISMIDDGAFRALPNLETISISGNNLNTLSKDTFSENLKIEKLYLEDNPWLCDCRLLWLINWLQGSGFNVLKDKPYCESPPRLQGSLIQDLVPFNLTEWPDECPEPCTCECVPDGNTLYIRINCSNDKLSEIPSKLPKQVGELFMNGNSIQSIDSVELLRDSSLKLLDLSNNLINDANTSYPVTLESLMLSGNKLERIYIGIFDRLHLKNLTLSRNPFICDCQSVSYKNWLKNSQELIDDVHEIRCGNKSENPSLIGEVIVALSDEDLCSKTSEQNIALYLIIAGGVLGGALLVSLCCVITCARMCCFTVKVWLHSKGITFLKRDVNADNKEYDVFLAYAEADKHLAQNIISHTLTSDSPPFRVYDSRSSHNNMDPITSINKCSRVIIILSPEFLEDTECMSILELAYDMSKEDKVSRVIIIKYGTLPSMKNLPYLIWGEKLFWEKLYFLLPTNPVSSRQETTLATVLHDGYDNEDRQLLVNS